VKLTRKNFFVIALGALTLLILIFIFRPSPVIVEVGLVTRGSLQVTVEEDGQTRVHDRFVLVAPVSGSLARIQFDEGDSVKIGQVVAVLTAQSIDPAERQELNARLKAAEALNRESREQVKHTASDYELAKRELQRLETLGASGFASKQSIEQARTAEITSRNEWEAAKYRAEAAAQEIEMIKARLIAADPNATDKSKLIELHSPTEGRVLRIPEKSERFVNAGTPIITLGDPGRLEVVIDVLSEDAVKISPGAEVLLTEWGGEKPLRGVVRTIESSAFTKISALGVEEQRVNVVADFVDPPETLGDGYRVEAQIVIWEGSDVLKVPSSALFRQQDQWAVFVVDGGQAHLRNVQIAHRNPMETEIRGLSEGTKVVLHPSNQITDGIAVQFQ
jgi:HlyD family secretion protein